MNRWSSLCEKVEKDEKSLKQSCDIVTKRAKSYDHMRNREADKKRFTQTPSYVFKFERIINAYKIIALDLSCKSVFLMTRKLFLIDWHKDYYILNKIDYIFLIISKAPSRFSKPSAIASCRIPSFRQQRPSKKHFK